MNIPLVTGKGSIQITGYAPTVSGGISNKVLTPATAHLELSSTRPRIEEGEYATQHLELTGYPPNVGNAQKSLGEFSSMIDMCIITDTYSLWSIPYGAALHHVSGDIYVAVYGNEPDDSPADDAYTGTMATSFSITSAGKITKVDELAIIPYNLMANEVAHMCYIGEVASGIFIAMGVTDYDGRIVAVTFGCDGSGNLSAIDYYLSTDELAEWSLANYSACFVEGSTRIWAFASIQAASLPDDGDHIFTITCDADGDNIAKVDSWWINDDWCYETSLHHITGTIYALYGNNYGGHYLTTLNIPTDGTEPSPVKIDHWQIFDSGNWCAWGKMINVRDNIWLIGGIDWHYNSPTPPEWNHGSFITVAIGEDGTIFKSTLDELEFDTPYVHSAFWEYVCTNEDDTGKIFLLGRVVSTANEDPALQTIQVTYDGQISIIDDQLVNELPESEDYWNFVVTHLIESTKNGNKIFAVFMGGYPDYHYYEYDYAFWIQTYRIETSRNVEVECAEPTHLQLTTYDAIYGYNDGLHSFIGLGIMDTDMMSLSIKRGRAHVLDRIESGTAQLQLWNGDGNYWTENAGSPFFPNVRPQTLVRIKKTYNGSTYSIYSGLVEELRFSFLQPPITAPVVELSCSDIIANLSKLKMNGVGYSLEKSGVRIGHVLDDLSWESTQRVIDTGDFNVIASGTLIDVNAWEHIDLVRLSEGGLFFIDGAGKTRFQDQSYRSGLSSQATFGDQAGDRQYHRVELGYDSFNIWNEVRLKREGGSQQLALDDDSIALYGKRVYLREDLILTSDSYVMQRTQQMLTKYKNPRLRVKKLIIRPDRDPDNLYPLALGLEISDMITVRLTESDIFERYHIEGIEHKWDAVSTIWETIWELSPVVTYEIIIETASLELQGYAPDIHRGKLLIPTKGALELQGYVPTITGVTYNYTPAAQSLEVTGYVPTVTNEP